MKKVELLAPAKDKNTAFQAINSGCDAIYIGASNFGARKKVPNSLEDIKEIVDYAHKFYVRVHVTVNTILDDKELIEAQKLIQNLYDIGVDAIIVQDMGIFKLAIDGKLPPIELHASTQCDNRTLKKVQFFNKLGVTRVILARELSLEQIKEICKNVNCEVETFIHGALCVSYSGQCYMSHYIGGRSANRGECAQACRKKYSLVDDKGNIIAKDKYLLSLKDFNASKHLEKLINSGVKSFKIEGRLKDENYVKNVVAFYRKEIDKFAEKTSSGKVFLDFEPDVNKSFNRGFTEYFLEGIVEGKKVRGLEDRLFNNSSLYKISQEQQTDTVLSPYRPNALSPENNSLTNNDLFAYSPNRLFTSNNDIGASNDAPYLPIYNFTTPKSIGEYLGKITKVGKNYFVIEGKKIGGLEGKPNKEGWMSGGMEVWQSAEEQRAGEQEGRLLTVENGKLVLDAKMHRCIEDKLFNDNSLSEISQEQQTDTVLSPYRPIALSSDNCQTSIPPYLYTSNLHPQDGLYFNGHGCLVNKVEGNKIYPNKMDGIKVGLDVYRNFDYEFEKKLTNSKTKRQIGVNFYYDEGLLIAQDEDNNSVKIEVQTGEQPKNPNKMRENFIAQLNKTGESDFYVENIKITGEIPFLPISKINEIRRTILDKLMEERLKNYPKTTQKPLNYTDFPTKELDYRANIHNQKAQEFYENCGCKITEWSAESGSRATELMRTKHCLKYAFGMCKSPKNLFLIDEKGKKFPLKFDCKNCEMVITAI